MVLDCAGGESKAKAHENFEMPCQLQSVIDELARQGKRGIGDDVIHGLRGQCEVLHHEAEATINDIGTGSRQAMRPRRFYYTAHSGVRIVDTAYEGLDGE
jgi:hypothetical protein